MVQNSEDDWDFDPMIYDAMRELATRVSGNYIAWSYQADEIGDTAASQHWQEEASRIGLEARAVDFNSRSAIQAKRSELREQLARMPDQPPSLGTFQRDPGTAEELLQAP